MALRKSRNNEKLAPLYRLVEKCSEALEVIYCSSISGVDNPDRRSIYAEAVRSVVRMLAVLIAADRAPLNVSSCEPMQRASQAVYDAAENTSSELLRVYTDSICDIAHTSGMSIFDSRDLTISPDAFSRAVQLILKPQPEAPIERLFFETVPLSWLGHIYQYLLSFRPAEGDDALKRDKSVRKGRGVFFTPPYLVNYITESVLSPLIESCTATLEGAAANISSTKVLDPSMGGADFLTSTIDFLAESDVSGRGSSRARARADLAANCVYGVDIDPVTVEVARFCVWAASGYADGVADSINRHLICANALGIRHGDEPPFDWAEAFPEVFSLGNGNSSCGFDAVVGNPPYVASKNGLGHARGSTAGQSDFYLMFLSAAVDGNLVKPGGMFSMVLPDPMLVRENAAGVRKKLITNWTITSLLHISEAFQDALVANVVPVCRNAPPSIPTFLASRIDKSGDRRSFMLRPLRTARAMAYPVRRETVLAQDRCELLYLLEQGSFGGIIRRIHGDNIALSTYQSPFMPLKKLNVRATYRGEEVGKSAINSENGDLPMLLGGQSIQPYEIVWEGRRANSSWVRKPLERYLSTKILVQKSSARIVAALDSTSKRHPGYVFPQSVYAVELREPGMSPYYLLCLLNSQLMNEYIWRTVTGYKFLQPQLELEDIRALPIRRINFITHISERDAAVAKGIRIFETESLRAGEGVPFPQLANYATECLSGTPEMSDVVHDMLVHLGKQMVDLAKTNRKSPSTDVTRRMEAARAAIEAIVWRLYSSEPAQITLPW